VRAFVLSTTFALALACIANAYDDPSSAVAILQTQVPGFKWDPSTSIEVDINADGIPDTAMLGYSEHAASIGVILGPPSAGPKVLHLQFPFVGNAQFGTCGRPKGLRVHPTNEGPMEALGAYPEGYRICARCVEIEITGDDCDPLMFFWNHKANTLGWWRA
jgi:hypothetical protein